MNREERPKHIFIVSIICFIAASFYIYDFVIRVIPAAFAHELTDYFGLHAGALGLLASTFFWGYAPMQIPSGVLYDRFSPRKILFITTLLCGLATLGFALTSSFTYALLTRFVMGITAAFAFTGALVVGARWFRGQYFAFYTGLVQFFGCMGAIIGISPVILLSHNFGWKNTIVIIASIGILLAFLILLVVKDAPIKHIQTTDIHINQAYRTAFTRSQTWWVALFGFAIWAPATLFATLWGVPYFTEKYYHFSNVAAGNLVSIIWWTIAFGGPIVGYLSKHFKTRRKPMLICSLIGCLSTLGILFLPYTSTWILGLLLVGYGIGNSALVIAFGLIVDLHPRETVGAITGFTNMAVIMGGVFLLPTIGFIIQRLWNGQMAGDLPVYAHSDFQIALLILPASFLLAFITSFIVKETHCEMTHIY